jgi:hypothetical protein
VPKLSCKLFQIQHVFVQAFPKKALAVLWNFNALQGPKNEKGILSKLFRRLRPPFSLIADVVAPYSAILSPKRTAFSGSRPIVLQGGREFMAAGSGLVQRYGQSEILT